MHPTLHRTAVALVAALLAALVPSVAPASTGAGATGRVIQPFPAVPRFSDAELRELDQDWRGKVYDLAPPAANEIVLRQPDGRAFKAVLPPAEVGGRLETATGHTIVEAASGRWVYARKGDEGLEPTARVVGVDSPGRLPTHLGRTQALWLDPTSKADIRTQLFEYFRSQSVAETQRAQAAGEQRLYKIPALMLETKGDFGPESTPENFEKFLSGFGTNPNGTVTEFYLEMSYGQMRAEVDVYGPYTSAPSQADPCHYGGITVAGNSRYESPQNQLTNGMAVGVGGGGVAGMAAEAVPQADPEVDFSQYDNDDDGYVDLVFIIHSGPDMAATGDACDTWSHAISLQPVTESISPVPAGIPTNDGVVVANMNTVPEVGLNVGVVSHEMSHNLGEPDFYDTSYRSQGTGDWDNMAGGSWFGDPPGSNPVHFNPMVKLAQAWIEPRVVESTITNLALRPWEVFPDLAMVPLTRGDDPNTDAEETDAVLEAFLLHNSSRTAHGPRNWGSPVDGPDEPAFFDRLLLNSGLVVWHMDRTSSSNNNSARYRLDLEEFDFLDTTQELALNHTRGEPTDPYFDTATGLSSATRVDAAGAPSAPISFAGTAPPSADAKLAPYTFEFDVPRNDANQLMQVEVTCASEGGDWDLYVDELRNGTWTQVASGATSACSESASLASPTLGARHRVRVYNWLAPDVAGGFTGEVSFDTAEVFARADTYDNDGNPSGWTIGNVRPKADGLQLSSEVAGPQEIVVDVVRDARADVSPGFLTTGRALRSGRAGVLRTEVFNNGGAAASDVVVQLRESGRTIARRTISSLAPGASAPVTFDYTPTREGVHLLNVAVTTSATESSTANNSQISELTAYATGATDGVLVVDDDGGFGTQQAFEAALTRLGVPYAVTHRHPSAQEMWRYRAVFWESGLERMAGQLTRSDVLALRSYLDGGGRVWFSSPRLAAGLTARSDTVTGAINPGVDPQFGADYLGIGYHDTVQRGGGVAAPVGTSAFGDSFRFRPFTGRPLQDVPRLAQSSVGTVTPVLDWLQSGQRVGTLGTLVRGDDAHGGFRVVFTGLNAASVTSAQDQVDLTRGVLQLLGVAASGYAPDAPVVHHAPLRSALRGEALEVSAVVAGTRVERVNLAYRPFGASTWSSVRMRNAGGGLYAYTLPASLVQPPGIEYRILVTRPDGSMLRAPQSKWFGYHVSVPQGPAQPHLPY